MKLHQLSGRLPVSFRFRLLLGPLLGALILVPLLTAAAPGHPAIDGLTAENASVSQHGNGESAKDGLTAESLAEPILRPGEPALSVPTPAPVEIIRGDYCGLENPVPGVYLICCKPSSNICIVTPEINDKEGIFRVPDATADSPARLFTAGSYTVSRSPSRIAVRFTGVKSLTGIIPR